MNYSKALNKKPQLVVVLIILIIFFMVFSIYGQNISQNNEIRKSLDFMFEHLDRNSVPNGLLRDYAVEDEDLDLFSGKVPLENDNIGTIIRFGNLLKTISSSAVKEDPIKSFEGTIQNYKKLSIYIIQPGCTFLIEPISPTNTRKESGWLQPQWF